VAPLEVGELPAEVDVFPAFVVPEAEGDGVLNANTEVILLAWAAFNFAPQGFGALGVPSCGHPVQFAARPI
jgi:hypothetical protein